MAKIHTSRDLFVDEWRDLYNTEQQLTRALPRVAKVFKEIGAPAKGKTCHAMKGLIEESQESVKEGTVSEVLNAGLIGAAQCVERSKISGYGKVSKTAQGAGPQKGSQVATKRR